MHTHMHLYVTCVRTYIRTYVNLTSGTYDTQFKHHENKDSKIVTASYKMNSTQKI